MHTDARRKGATVSGAPPAAALVRERALPGDAVTRDHRRRLLGQMVLVLAAALDAIRLAREAEDSLGAP
jgi:hypothetical protein